MPVTMHGRQTAEPGPTPAAAGTADRRLLDEAIHAVDLAMSYLQRQCPGRVTSKGDRDMASEADFAVERTVRQVLAERTPHIGFRGEETGSIGPDDEQWILDPIDGTANFVHGIPLCAVSLGLRQAGEAVLGVVGLPFLRRRYWAAAGLGAYRDGAPISARRTLQISEAIVAVGDYSTGLDAAARNRADHALHRRLAAVVQRVRMLGSAALDLVWVAEGGLDASITLSNRPWDMTAGVVIAREAGADVVDADGTRHGFVSSTTIAVVPELRADVTALVSAALADAGYLPQVSP